MTPPAPSLQPTPSGIRWWHTWWFRSLLVLAALLLALLVTLTLALDHLVRSQALAAMDRFLLPSHALERVGISLVRGRVEVTGVRIDQPSGFTGEPLAQLDRVVLDVALNSVLGRRITVEELAVEGLTVRLVRTADGQVNLAHLLRPAGAASPVAVAETAPPAAGPESSAGAEPPPTLVVRTVRLERLTLLVEDQVQGSWTMELRDLRLAVYDLELDAGAGLGWERLALRIARIALDQPPEFAATVVGLDSGLIQPGGAATAASSASSSTTASFAAQAIAGIELEVGPVAGLGADPAAVVTGDGQPWTARLDLASLTASWLRGADRRSNVDATAERLRSLLAAAFPPDSAAAGGTTIASVPAAPGVSAAPGRPQPPIRLVRFRLADGALALADEGAAEDGTEPPPPFRLVVDHLQAEVLDLWLGIPPAGSGTVPAWAGLDLQFRQPAGNPPAWAALLARVGPVPLGSAAGGSASMAATEAAGTATAIPDLAARFQLTGFALDTIDSLIPSGTRSALGGDAFDARFTAAISPDRLHLRGEAITETGVRYPFGLGGTPTAPEVSSGPIMTAAFRRFGGGVWDFGGRGVALGKEIAAGGLSVAGSVGKGILKTGASLGKGLFNTVAGAVTLDGDQLGTGLGQATVGTARAAAGTVTGAGSAMGGGVLGSADAMGGGSAEARWFQAAPARHAQAVAEDRAALQGP